MDILKECHCLYQHYYKTWNCCLNICLLKIKVLLLNHENHLQTIFLPKSIAYLLSYFLSQHFLYHPFHSQRVLCLIFVFFPCQIKYFCILCKRSNGLLWSLVISQRCITLETANGLKTVIFLSKVNCVILKCFLSDNMFGKVFVLFKIFLIRKMNTKYFHGFIIKIYTFSTST